ncbi:cystinosin-like protein [Hibiscus syriacus]|uniref:Cystinosin-like protein n=1 Tax=Hibiscus syriacus TaxID=106335 RepID=A0A6A2XHG0_HIBSY|nr:cystinosin-like protein [Hibiscus syriacus]
MAATLLNKALKPIKHPSFLSSLRSLNFTSLATNPSDGGSTSSPFTFDNKEKDNDSIYLKPSTSNATPEKKTTSVTTPISFMTGSIVGKRFYKKVTTRESDDGIGWTVMLDYRTLKTPSKRPLKLPTLALAKAIAAEWEYQQTDGIRPFTMPLMKLACTALERVPLTRTKVIEHLMKKFDQDLVFCRAPEDNTLNAGFFGGKQGEGLTKAVENLLKKTDDCELAAIDALAAAAHSLVIALGIFRGKLQIEEAIELIRLEEDLQVGKWGLVEGGHDIDIADLKVQIASATVFLGLSRKNSLFD